MKAGEGYILLVEGDDDVATIIIEILEMENRYRVEVVTDGALALEQMEREMPRLILMDLRLFDMDGLELYRRIQERWGKGPPIVVMDTLSRDRLEKVQEGRSTIKAVLSKPFSIEALVETVQAT